MAKAAAPVKAKKSFDIPKTLGACADALYTTRQERLVEQKDIKLYEEFEKRLKEHIITELPKSDSTGVSGKVANAKVISDVIPTAEDWDKLYAYIKKNNRFDLLQRRLNEQAVMEMWEEGKEIPGVGRFNVLKISVTKV